MKLEAAAVSVNEMTAEANIKREEVNSAVENNSKLLAEINAKKTEAMKKKEFIDSESDKVTIEAKECQRISEEAKEQLDSAMPALEAATEAVKGLEKKHINEIKAYT